MDKFLNEQEQWLLELVETKSFTELSDAERAFVLEQMTQAEFELQRHLINQTREMVEDLDPKPLQLAEKKSGPFILIPLYQAVIGVAATLILSFLFIESGQSPVSEHKNMELAIADTVFIEKQIVDTVVKYEYIDRVVHTECETFVSANSHSTPIKHDIAITKPVVPPLNELNLHNKGVSLVDDKTFSLVYEVK